jgi:RNA polymerase sigma factor (sigma-70 family)
MAPARAANHGHDMDADQFTALLGRHARLIHKVTGAYCRNRSDHDDVVQEVATALWRARDRYDPRFRETTWVYRVALNVAISFYRRHRRHLAEPLDDDTPAAASGDGPTSIDEVRRLHGFIAALGEVDRALVLLFLDDQDHATMAEVLGLSVSAVGTRLGRIKDKLRVAFARQEQADGRR